MQVIYLTEKNLHSRYTVKTSELYNSCIYFHKVPSLIFEGVSCKNKILLGLDLSFKYLISLYRFFNDCKSFSLFVKKLANHYLTIIT